MSLPKKPRACRICKSLFQPRKALQNVCSFECEVKLGIIMAERSKKRREQAERVAEVVSRKILKLKLKTRGEWIKETQAVFNAFIRTRDQLAGHNCISSGRPLDWSGNNVDAGHYRSRGSAPHLRFNEDNCHAQTKQENRYASGNVVDYRIGLIARIGLARVEALEADNTPRKWTIEELKAIKSEYKQKLKELQRGN